MTDLDDATRRVLAHLAVPRTQTGLRDRVNADASGVSIDVDDYLSYAVDQGWAVNLGSGDPETIVAAVGDNKDSIGFGKGAGKIWRTRAEAGRYDSDGDYYILSQAGLDALRGTDEEDGEVA